MKLFNSMKAKVLATTIMFAGFALPMIAFADDVAAPADFSFAQMIQGVIDAFTQFKSAGAAAGAVAVLVLLIGTMKNSMARQYVWDKLPKLMQTLAAPILSLAVAALSMKAGGSWLVALTTGAGAIAAHEVLDGLKTIPGIGPMYVAVIDLIGTMLLKKDA